MDPGWLGQVPETTCMLYKQHLILSFHTLFYSLFPYTVHTNDADVRKYHDTSDLPVMLNDPHRILSKPSEKNCLHSAQMDSRQPLPWSNDGNTEHPCPLRSEGQGNKQWGSREFCALQRIPPGHKVPCSPTPAALRVLSSLSRSLSSSSKLSTSSFVCRERRLAFQRRF